MQPIGMVYTTVDSEIAANKLAEASVNAGLAACVNIFPMHSVYRWEGKVEHAKEWSLRFKTTVIKVEALVVWLKAHHPYELPAIWWSETAAEDAYAKYVAWS